MTDPTTFSTAYADLCSDMETCGDVRWIPRINALQKLHAEHVDRLERIIFKMAMQTKTKEPA